MWNAALIRAKKAEATMMLAITRPATTPSTTAASRERMYKTAFMPAKVQGKWRGGKDDPTPNPSPEREGNKKQATD